MVSGDQIAAIQGHWNSKVKGNLQAVGNALFLKYFAANPADQALFSKFAGVAHGDLAGNSAFQAQTLVVMQYMEKIVNSLGGGAADLMAAQVPSHKGWGVDSSYFKKMFDFIPGFMADNGADGACVNAWKSAGAELVAATK